MINRVAVILVAISLISTTSFAQTTQPATGDKSSDIRQWFKQLADRDPEVREAARTKLMSIPRARLDELKTVVADSRPLAPSQSLELREIVRQVFLAGEPYTVDRETPGGFLGVRLGEVVLPDSDGAGGDESERLRVIVTSRLPGFNAYPVLRDGDVILRVLESEARLASPDVLQSILREIPPGRTVHLEIQRGGKTMRVGVKLSMRAETGGLNADRSSQFIDERDTAASDYWDANFASLIEENKPL